MVVRPAAGGAPLRVLYLTMNPNRASTTVPTEGWFRLLPARGLQPVLVSRTDGGFQAWTRARGIPTYDNPLPFPDKRRLGPFLLALWRLRRVVRRHRIQLIHCNEQDVYPIGQYAARLCRVPVVVSVHFTMDRGFAEWAFGGRRQPARIFFVSRGNLEACRPAVDGVIDAARRRVMYNGLDLERFAPDPDRRERFRRAHRMEDAVVVGVACALRPRKQLEHLVEAAARHDDARVRVVIAGGPVPGDEAYAERLLRDARDRLRDRLIVLGHLDELRDFYNGLDVFVNTSQEEACSISVMESLACGTPVLGYASKSVDDQILPEGGEIVAQDDVGQLARRLAAWTADGPALAARRAGARARAEAMFDIRGLSDQLWDEYRYRAIVTVGTP
jgi:glycosyltransferase involved in cell wall biosynthesis